MKIYLLLVLVGGVLAANAERISGPGDMSLHFNAPGKTYPESCVVGNGRLGAMDLGGVDKDRIVLNESSMWSGGPYEANKSDAFKCLPEVRAKLFANDIAGAGTALNNSFRYADGIKGWWDINQFGCYQTLGDLTLEAVV